MDPKKTADVIIAGKVYRLSGREDEDYIQRVAAYINSKLDEFQKLNNYNRKNKEEQALLLQLNIADDYFQMKKKCDEQEQKLLDMEKELYGVKHALITEQMKKESLEERVSFLQEELTSRRKNQGRHAEKITGAEEKTEKTADAAGSSETGSAAE